MASKCLCKEKALGTMVVIDGDMVIYSISVFHVLIEKLLTVTVSNSSKRIINNHNQKLLSIMENERSQQGFHKKNYFSVKLAENIIKVKTCIIVSTHIYKCIFTLKWSLEDEERNISFYENFVVIFGFK